MISHYKKISVIVITVVLLVSSSPLSMLARSNLPASNNQICEADKLLSNSSAKSLIIEEFDSPDDFVSTDPDVYIADGKVNWTVYRNGGEQYVYRSIPSFSGDVRLTVVGQLNSATNNCQVWAGIGDAPGTGISTTWGYFGGGCPVQGYLIKARGVSLDLEPHLCTPPPDASDWLWVDPNTTYTATLTVRDNVTLMVDGIGSVTGSPQYTGIYNTLYVGYSGDGDWPSCSGSIERMIVEPLDSNDESSVFLPIISNNYPSAVTASISPPQETDQNGMAVFHLPEGDIEVTVVDENWGAPIENIQLQVVSESGKALVLMLDPQENYYPQVKEVNLLSLANGPQSVEAIPVLLIAAVALEGYSIYQFVSDLPDIDSYGLGWVETCWTPEQMVHYIEAVSGVAGLIKLKAEMTIKALDLLLKGGETIAGEILVDTVNALWCENQWPSPFKVRYTIADTIFPLFSVLDDFPLEGCGAQVSTCPPESGHLYGTVTDATNGQPLEFVEILFPYRPSISEATNSSGYYSTYRAPAGYSTVQAQLSGYAPESKVVYIPEGGEAELNFSLSPVTDDEVIRAVLTWGSSPSDLDAHLWLPESNPYHIYYGDKGDIDNFPWAELDYDDTTGYGPETITLRIDKVDGRYTIAVYQYSSSGDIATSGATVSIYRGDTTLKTYKVSDAQGSGRWWYIADFEPHQTIIGTWIVDFYDVNQLQTSSPR